MYKNQAYHADYGTNPNTTKDTSIPSYQQSSANNSQSTNDYTDSRLIRPGVDHVPSYYYKDYVPVNSIPQTPNTPSTPHTPNTPNTPSDNVFTTMSSGPRMNGHVIRPSTSSKCTESPDSTKKPPMSDASSQDKPITIPVLNLYGVHSNIATIGLMSVLSLAISILAMQLLLTMSGKGTPNNDTVKYKLVDIGVYEGFYQATVALSSVVVMLNLTCTLVCTMQCFFVSRLLKLRRGYRRAFIYLKECSAVRLISVTGFFLSIPTFLLALILYCIMELRSTAAIISIVVIGLGLVLCFAAYIETLLHLNKHNNNSPEELVEADNKEGDPRGNVVYGLTQQELSTLV